MGLLFATAVVLSYIEGMVSVPGLPPGVKLGLSNIVTMYCVFFLGVSNAYTLAAVSYTHLDVYKRQPMSLLNPVSLRWPI